MSAPSNILLEINQAIGAHGAWKLKLTTAINTGRSDKTPTEVSCDNLCAFGKWLYGPTISQEVRRGRPYQVIRRLHADFHRVASEVLELAMKGDRQAARAMMEGDYAEKSDRLAKALMKWRKEVMAAQRAAA